MVHFQIYEKYIGMVYAMLSIGVLGWASVRMFIELITIIRQSRLGRRVRNLSYVRVNNLIVRKNRETIACYVNRVVEENLIAEYQYSKKTLKLKNYPWLTLILWNVSFFWYNATAGYRELNLRQLWGSLLANPTKEVNLLPSNYLIALGTRNENTTKDNTWDSAH